MLEVAFVLGTLTQVTGPVQLQTNAPDDLQVIELWVITISDEVTSLQEAEPRRDTNPRQGTSDAQGQEPNAQKPDAQQDEKPPTPPHTGIRALLDGLRLDIKDLPSTPNLYIALLGGGAALAVHPLDSTFNVHLQSNNPVVNGLFAPAKYYGDTPEQVGLALGAYAFGRIFDEPKVSHLAMDVLRAEAIGELIVEPLKVATQRRRPDGSNSLSFPSGHSAATFAAATVIERHLGWKHAVLGYAIASYVAASRLHDNVHYLSDVVFGAAVGTIAGRTVTEHGRETWSLSPVAVPGGTMLVLARTWTQ